MINNNPYRLLSHGGDQYEKAVVQELQDMSNELEAKVQATGIEQNHDEIVGFIQFCKEVSDQALDNKYYYIADTADGLCWHWM